MGGILQDLRYGLRMLLKKAGYTSIAVITLTLGIGATTAIFTVVNAVLLRPLAYDHPERIMSLDPDLAGYRASNASETKFVFWREHNQSFDAVAATKGIGSGVNLSGANEPEFVNGVRVSADFFRVIGVHPALGRDFTAEEDSPGGEPVMILTDSLWRRRFGGDPQLLGKTVAINARDFTVVGVMPPGFRYGEHIDLLVPMRTNPASREEGHNYTVLGRIRPGVSQQQAAADTSITQRIREIGIRLAPGAAPGDVLRLIVLQGMLPAMIGVAIGIGGAYGLTRLLASFLYGVTATDPLTFVATAVLLGIVALVACLVPARRAARVDPMIALRYE